MSRALAHSKDDIERLLEHGSAPITDNETALVELGFTRAYPQVQEGYEAMVWERSVDHGCRETHRGLRRVMARQRAYLKGVRHCAKRAC